MQNESSNNKINEDGEKIEKSDNKLLSIINHCGDDFFDWLTLNELAALNLTCRRLEQLTTEYFQRKYPMKTMKVGQILGTNAIHYRCNDKSMQAFKQNVRNLVVLPTTECLHYLRLNHSKDIVSIAFYDGEIADNAIDDIAELVKNAEIIEIQYGSIHSEFYDSVLKFCKCIKQLIIKYGFTECEISGIENQWLLRTYPTLEHFHWSRSPLLDRNLDTFFRLNPQIQSFNGSVYTTMTTILFLTQTGICINELHLEIILELYEENKEGVEIVQTHLNRLYENKQIKSLMLQYSFYTQFLDLGWEKLEYLHGVYFDFSYETGSTKTLSKLVNLKLLVLGINTTLSRAKANILANHLINLEEIYVQINSIHAISPFLRKSIKLQKIYVYGIGLAKCFSGKFKMNHMSLVNRERMKLRDACKITVFLPDQAYIQMKWKSHDLNFSLIEIKRSESHILRHPFAATILHRDICEMYEMF